MALVEKAEAKAALRIIVSSADSFIRCVTKDAKNQPRADEFEVEVEDGFSLAGGPWKWVDGKKVAPTPEEITARENPGAAKVAALEAAIAEVEADATITANRKVQALLDAAKARG